MALSLGRWSAELWRDATVFSGQYIILGRMGAPIDVGSILLGFILTYVIGEGDRPAFWLALAGSLLFLASLAVWLSVVAPANTQMASWTPGPLAPDFEAVRLRWETVTLSSLASGSLVSCSWRPQCSLCAGRGRGRASHVLRGPDCCGRSGATQAADSW